MGRHAEFRPFRQKKDGSEYGAYRAYNPVTRKVESLETKDYNTALAIMEAWKLNAKAGGKAESTPQVSTTVKADNGTKLPVSSSNVAPEGVPAGAPTSIPASTIIGDWIKGGMLGSDEPQSETPRPHTDAAVNPTLAQHITKPKKGITPEQAAKIGKGATALITKLNLVALHGCVSFLGKDPYPVDSEELDLLKMGWEMYLDEFFIKHKPQPWMLILAGNVMIGAAMYLRGKDKDTVEVDDSQILESRSV